MFSKQLVVAGVLICSLAWWNRPAVGQEVCRGDVDDDGIVDAGDAGALPAVLFDAGVEPEMLARADANDDGVITAGDVVAILRLNGFPCADVTPAETSSPSPGITATQPTETATRTPSVPTPTATVTATPTTLPTPPPTPTPTAICMVQNLSLGTTNGELSAGDCQQVFSGTVSELRYTDVYSIVGIPGQAIRIDVAGTGTNPLTHPFLAVIDAATQFGRLDVAPPIEFVVTSSQPYLVYVTSAPATPAQFGTYQLTAAARTCPPPIPLTVSTALHLGRLDGSECPEPATPQNPDAPDPADVYKFIVTQGLTNLQILMRQTNYAEDINPVFSVIGPDGYELFSPDDDDDAAPGINNAAYLGLDAGTRFLATVPGTYTLIARGNGGLGGYSLQVSSPGSPFCSPKPLGTLPSTGPLSRTGQLFGDYRKGCGPPLPIPGVSDDVPSPNSGADLYTFTAQAGDVISVEMDSTDEPHLFLYGPASAGNPRVAQDDLNQSGSFGTAQLAATLALPGTYTIVAANNNPLTPPDPDPQSGDLGDIVDYTLLVQKCPVAGTLVAGVPRSSTLTVLDCLGFGGLPFRSYAFVGTAGQFVSVSMSSPDLDAAVRLLGPDGSQVYNDNDLVDQSTGDARVNRILPAAGMYFVEVSASLTASGELDLTNPAPGFTVQVQTCSTTAALAGTVSGAFRDSDCELTPGRKYDVYTFAGPAAPAQRVASISPPPNSCLVGLYAEGLQTPDGGCSDTDLLEIPAVTSGKYGFMVVADDETVRDTYSFQYRNCPLSTLSFGSSRNGALSSSSCADADGIGADWYLIRGAADLVSFNSNMSGAGVSGEVTAGFGGLLTDFTGDYGFLDSFSDDAASLLPLGRHLAALIKVSGPAPGTYTLNIDTATTRQ